MIIDGSWFVAKLDGEMFATRFTLEGAANDIGTIRGTLGAITSPASYVLVVQDDSTTKYRAPRLAPAGKELFLRLEAVSSQTSDLGRVTRMPGTNIWDTVNKQSVDGMTYLPTDDPSPPTTTVPRRMVVSRAAGFVELEETQVGNEWTVVRQQSAVQYDSAAGSVAFLGEAHLTTDGRRLVFRGQVGANMIGAFFLERATLDVAFESPAKQLPAKGSVSHPYWTPDCKTLFYDRNNDGQVYRVTY